MKQITLVDGPAKAWQVSLDPRGNVFVSRALTCPLCGTVMTNDDPCFPIAEYPGGVCRDCFEACYECKVCQQLYHNSSMELAVVGRDIYCLAHVPSVKCPNCDTQYASVDDGVFLTGCRACEASFTCQLCMRHYPEMVVNTLGDLKFCPTCIEKVAQCGPCGTVNQSKAVRNKGKAREFCPSCIANCVICGKTTSSKTLSDEKRCTECVKYEAGSRTISIAHREERVTS